MEFKQIQTEMRKLDKAVGKDTSEAILKLMDLKAQTFEQKLDMLSNEVKQINAQMNIQNNNIKTLIAIVGLLSVLASIAGQFIN
ncbi:MAG: hypothetical protein GDA51_06815 [Ekhidna sp.]|nr:hypothetical protein [Ekhidna sp.]MBC6409665.1 hypothetical protein [Ekhidna sp.]MBC6426169.1 hypothetical protein [Ekhidna sp.]